MDNVKCGIPVRQSRGRVKEAAGHSGVDLQTVVRILQSQDSLLFHCGRDLPWVIHSFIYSTSI